MRKSRFTAEQMLRGILSLPKTRIRHLAVHQEALVEGEHVAGFREIGPEGRALEEQLQAEARRFDGMRIIGPNCLGIIAPALGLNASFAPSSPKAGHVAFVSQSVERAMPERQSAGAALVGEYVDRVFRFLRALTGNEEMAAEPTQETFLKLHQALPGLPEGAARTAYVFATARNTAISHFRRKDREKRYLAFVPAEELEEIAGHARAGDPADELERAEFSRGLANALAGMPEAERAAFLLAEIEELPYAEIARVLGCPMGTVASRKHRAVRLLRGVLRRNGLAL